MTCPRGSRCCRKGTGGGGGGFDRKCIAPREWLPYICTTSGLRSDRRQSRLHSAVCTCTSAGRKLCACSAGPRQQRQRGGIGAHTLRHSIRPRPLPSGGSSSSHSGSSPKDRGGNALDRGSRAGQTRRRVPVGLYQSTCVRVQPPMAGTPTTNVQAGGSARQPRLRLTSRLDGDRDQHTSSPTPA